MSAAAFGYVVWAVVCVGALLLGGALRIASVAMLLAIFATPLLQAHKPPPGIEYGIFAVDLALLAVFVGLYLERRHRWLLFATAFQLLETLTHAARLIDIRIHSRSYQLTMLIWSIANLTAVFVGAMVTAWRRYQPRPSHV